MQKCSLLKADIREVRWEAWTTDSRPLKASEGHHQPGLWKILRINYTGIPEEAATPPLSLPPFPKTKPRGAEHIIQMLDPHLPKTNPLFPVCKGKEEAQGQHQNKQNNPNTPSGSAALKHQPLRPPQRPTRIETEDKLGQWLLIMILIYPVSLQLRCCRVRPELPRCSFTDKYLK